MTLVFFNDNEEDETDDDINDLGFQNDIKLMN